MGKLEPLTTEKAVETLRECHRERVPVRIVGGGTKCGWGHPPQADIELSTRALNRIREHNEDDFTVVVEAGLRLSELQNELAKRGRRVALDPPLGVGDQATIGGIVAAADAGPLRHRYGSPRDLLLGATVAVAGGEGAKIGGKVIKNVAGYDLGKLFAGSMGTVGLLLEVVLRIHPTPSCVLTVRARGRDASAIAAAAERITASSLEPEAIDLYWNNGEAELLVLVSGDAAEITAERVLHNVEGPEVSAEVVEGEELWQRQRERQRAAAPDTMVRVSATASRNHDVIRAASDLGAAAVGRAAHGVWWLAFTPASDADALAAIEGLRARLAPSPCVILDAPKSVRRTVDVWGIGATPEATIMREIKARFDPVRICNPGLMGDGL